jgi:hypothetical protein
MAGRPSATKRPSSIWRAASVEEMQVLGAHSGQVQVSERSQSQVNARTPFLANPLIPARIVVTLDIGAGWSLMVSS